MLHTVLLDGLDSARSVVDVASSVITAVAILVGGSWAYFKFVKGRTFRPRLGVELASQWIVLDGQHRLHARITVRNVGASAITLLQEGTGLRVSTLAELQPAAPAAAAWKELRVFEVLGEHEWIEPSETVSDDLLLDLGLPQPTATLFEARLVWRYARRRKEIVVFARQLMPPRSTIDATMNGGTVTAS